MGKTLDALQGRSFKGWRLTALVNLAISRLAILKQQRQFRCASARSDVLQLLQASQHERALIRVEQVIKEQNMLDAFAMIEGYCILLSERINLTQQQKDCPDELKEAISTLIFAASRSASAEFPELQRLRSLFVSRYGKEFVLRAIELRNDCGVSPKMIQKLSTRQSSLENRIKALKEIADANGIRLRLEDSEAPSTPAQEKLNNGDYNRQAKNPSSAGSGFNFEDELKDFPEEIKRVEILSLLLNRSQRYKDAAEAAQEAFLFAAYAAAAARAAMELSRSSPGGSPHDFNYPKYDQRKMFVNSITEISEAQYSWADDEDSVLGHDKVHPLDDYSHDSESDDMSIKQIDPRSISSGTASGLLVKIEQNLKFEESDDEAKSEKWGERGTMLPHYSHKPTDSGFETNSREDNEEQISARLAVKCSQKLNTVRPFSVRTRR